MDDHLAPSARKVACIDLDKTIIPWGPVDTIRPAFPGVRAAIDELIVAGYRIVILTSRLSPTWWRAETDGPEASALFGLQQTELVHRILSGSGIHYDQVTAEKVPAAVYFDDKAVRVDENYTLVTAILDFLEGQA